MIIEVYPIRMPFDLGADDLVPKIVLPAFNPDFVEARRLEQE